MAREEPLGPRKLPLGELTDDDFQECCHRLIRLKFPEVVLTDTLGEDGKCRQRHGA
jgi:hypothetical protein